MISIDDFKKFDIRIGAIISAERVQDADKLLKLIVDVGEVEPRQIISGIAEYIAPEEIVGAQCPFIVNLEPKIIKGLESQGMILAASDEAGIVLLHPRRGAAPGSVVR